MRLTVNPGYPLHGEVTVPGDKSICHRVMLLAALADGDSYLDNFLFAGVTRVMLNALNQMGLKYEIEGTRLIIHGRGPEGIRTPEQPINCGNSATTIRLLAGFFSMLGIPAVLSGSPGLCSRPMQRIIEPLQAMGVPIQGTSSGTAPLILQARPRETKLHACHHQLPVASAQVKSTLLLAALSADGVTTISEPGPSRDHTELLLQSLGIKIESEINDPIKGSRDISLTPPQELHFEPLQLIIPGDFSSAAFLMVAGTITPGSSIKINHVGLNPTRIGLLEVLQAMGGKIEVISPATVHHEETGNLLIQPSALHGTNINGPLVVRMIDEFPVFTTAAVFSQGQSLVSEAEELRFKESDRIQYLVKEFISLEAQIEEKPDGYRVFGKGRLGGGDVNSWKDHRLAMSLAVAGLAADSPITIQGAEIISESFPNFITELQQLGAKLDVFND